MDWGTCIETVGDVGVATISCVEILFARVVAVIAVLGGFAFFAMLLAGGFRYVAAGDNAKEAEAAKGTLTAAFLGLFLIVGTYIILTLLSSFTGLDLTTFHLTSFPGF